MFEKKYPYCQGLFIFDNALSHKKKADDALNVDRMNVRDGGKQPFMHDTIYNGTVQQMTTAEGLQKGLKTVLQERGVDTEGMNSSHLRDKLRQYPVSCAT